MGTQIAGKAIRDVPHIGAEDSRREGEVLLRNTASCLRRCARR
jgi:hypothetical protein